MNRDLCRAWLRAALAIAAAVAPPALFADCAELDDPTQILDFYLEIDPSDWDDVREHHGRDEEEEFVERPALFRCGDEAALPVMVRQKQGVGGPDREHPDKFPLKIDFDDRVEDGEWHGRRKIVLENGGAEVFHSLFREGLGWQLLARAGMISGGSSWVRLHVNDQLIGVFIRVEQYDKAFLRRYLDEDDGFLYRYDYKVPGHVERLTREDEVDPYAAALCFAPFGSGCEPPSSGLAELLGRHVDLEQLFTLAAVGGIVANWDAPFLNDNNYFWYNSEPRRRLHFAWDLDLIITEEEIGRDVHDSLLIKDNGWQLLFQNDPVLRARFDATISRLLDDAMSEEALSHFLDELEPTLASAFDADANTGLGIAFAAEVASVRDWFRRRVQIVRSQIAPSPRFPLVINEVLAANDSGIEDESGEREDWIELYNRGSEPVQLHGLYLSDDPANPAGWPLPSGTLQPGERMLVWCDGDVAPDSWHANFRLDAHGESVGLYEVTADDYRVRDFVYFGPLANDVSLARIPDGGPAFHAMRCPTPGATNRASCESDPVFIRGDASQDGVTNLTDALAILAQLFQGSSSACRLAADVDADGSLSLTDAVALLLHLFQGAPPPPAPFPACGTAAPAGDLDCVESACGSAE